MGLFIWLYLLLVSSDGVKLKERSASVIEFFVVFAPLLTGGNDLFALLSVDYFKSGRGLRKSLFLLGSSFAMIRLSLLDIYYWRRWI